MKPFDVLVIGELNTDLILNKLSAFPERGREILADEMTVTLGSSSAIFASNLSVLGTRVAFLGKTGDDSSGDLLVRSLREKSVDTSYVQRDPHLSTGATVVLNYGEDRAIITFPGAMAHLTLEDIPPGSLSQARHLHFSSYFLQPGIQKDIPALFSQARQLGLSTSLDPQLDPADKWDMDLEHILPFTDIFFPNESELLRLTKTNSLNEALNFLEKFETISVVKQGAKGSTVCTNGSFRFLESYRNTKVVDTIGAGDSFAAGFIHEFLKGSPIALCQKVGNVMGAVSTTGPGGTTAFVGADYIFELAHRQFGFSYENLRIG